ncbi:MarR family winged helix-turn-helix transcriptional regulator [Taibaiella chishuiensis]|uniref:DNA-binding MarR family transcriptional regulator n=1 Tax=Taibaiella chishuiensis TaxID=1434707 RepID=A0A2P8D7M8_9BACT|nr:MarR family transcriptional regulator [Taibaiella chishuiensis]PSK93212.1 DNA-binding MarR family transcriptional regulator [Taibaiella chishuiensis]
MSTVNSSLQLLMNLSRAQAIIARRLDSLSAHGLGFNDLVLLYLVGQAPGGKIKRIDLADKTGLTASGITRLLLPLEKTGLVARKANARDARVSLVTLTAAGRRVLKEALHTANAVALDLLPKEQLKTNASLPGILKLLGANITV